MYIYKKKIIYCFLYKYKQQLLQACFQSAFFFILHFYPSSYRRLTVNLNIVGTFLPKI